jgi:plasmid stabilization system protein ParE
MHEVILTARAQDELKGSHDWWAQHRSRRQADQWYAGFVRAMLLLEENPDRCPLAPESDLFPDEVRQLFYGLSGKPTHRAIYTIRPDTVVILRVRHLAQKPLSEPDS